MAYEIPGFAYSERADDAIVPRFNAVQIGANGAVIAVATEAIDGIAQMESALNANETIRIMKTGISIAIAGAGGVTRGSEVEVGAADGVLQDQVAGVTVGKALETAAAGEWFSVLLY